MAKTTGLTEQDVCDRIRDSVLEQRLAPGTKLTEESLCSVFGVGRTTVRRAFLLLSRDNIIELEKNKGAVVASPSPQEARQVFEARIMVEKALLEATVKSIGEKDVAALRAHVAQEAAALASADIARWIRLTGDFHLLLARLSNNALMCEFLERLVFQTSLILALYSRGGAAPNCRGGDHEQLVDALEAGDGDLAASILAGHLGTLENQLNFSGPDRETDLQSIFSTAASA